MEIHLFFVLREEFSKAPYGWGDVVRYGEMCNFFVSSVFLPTNMGMGEMCNSFHVQLEVDKFLFKKII